ncbi:MAG: recombinase family protein [Sphaerochaeta sp.]|nr:recombinase family protein [Sphaerochaeta sp.]
MTNTDSLAFYLLKICEWYEKGWSLLKIKKELEALRVPTPTSKKKWPVKTIENILTNEKYTGTSVYGETETEYFPSTKRMVSNPLEVHRSRNHHPPIIHERRFKRVQKLKAKRSNIEVDEHGNKVRKSTVGVGRKQP